MPTPGRHPYYIVSPAYTRTSAGIRVLHFLCHALNSIGQTAFMVFGRQTTKPCVNPDLTTPVLDRHIVAEHFAMQITPIAVYPEIVTGNPFRSPTVVRYFLNFPGLLGGDTAFSSEEICFGYSGVLAKAAGAPTNILHIPIVDTRVFTHSEDGRGRQGSCFYAGKLKEYHRGSTFGLPSDCVEIHRSGPNPQEPQENAELYRRSELFYCFENSSLATEAALCGCPVVFMYNEFFQGTISADEIGWDGFARGDGETEVARAKATVSKVRANYARTLPRFWEQLDRFVELTQQRAAEIPYLASFALEHGTSKSFRLSSSALSFEAGITWYAGRR
jgi:hypothetical protein